MSETLTLEVSDRASAALQRQTHLLGSSPAEVAVRVIERSCPEEADLRDEAEKQAARERFRRHAGAVRLGSRTGLENQAIDAGRARECL